MRPWNKKWSKKKIIEDVTKLVKTGVSIKYSDIVKSHPSLFVAAYRPEYFGSWSRAVQKAGFGKKYKKILKKAYFRGKVSAEYKRWNKEVIKERIKELIEKGVSLQPVNILRGYPRLYYAAFRKRHFGSWRNAVNSTGYNYDALIRKLLKKRRKSKYVFLNKSTQKMIDDWQKALREKNISKEVCIGYLRSLKRFDIFLGGLDVKDISVNEIKEFMRFLRKKGLREKTVRGELITLKNLFGHCYRNNVISRNPILEVSLPRVDYSVLPVLSMNELESFMGYLNSRKGRNNFTLIRDRILVELIIYCGLRRSELVKLMCADIQLDEKTILLRQGKHKKDRMIPINEVLAATIRSYLYQRRECSKKEFLLTSYKNRGLSKGQISMIFKSLSISSGLKIKVGAHILRHTFASLLLTSGVDIATIGKLMGHSTISTTYNYVHASPDYLRKEIQKHPLINIHDKTCDASNNS
ncbi:tyrosine-type recombinase/integrase [bacterium]|nr:tyrosine-type recombinase/integrase [bacterium]